MSTYEQFVARLEPAARAWVGTPFRANSAAKGAGGGVCCHLLVVAIYAEAGLDLRPVPDGPPLHARFNKKSIMEPWLDACPKVNRRAAIAEAKAGDLLGFYIGEAIHHIAVMLPGDRIVHAIHGAGVVINPLKDPTWSERLAAVWEPIITP
jgi:cell wall-associated NlpC family hydrolase